MSSRSWVCFDCRKGVRREADSTSRPSGSPPVRCPDCGGPCTNLGYKRRIPKKRDAREWSRLRASLVDERRLAAEEGQRARTARKHAIERELAELRARPVCPDRSRLIRQLEARLRADE